MPDTKLLPAKGGKLRTQRTSNHGRIVQLTPHGHAKNATAVHPGWTLKGVPSDTVELTRKAARTRGMRIGSWVAESLHKAAMRDLGEPLRAGPGDIRILDKIDQAKEELRAQIERIANQNQNLDQEISLIRRGLLPKLINSN